MITDTRRPSTDTAPAVPALTSADAPAVSVRLAVCETDRAPRCRWCGHPAGVRITWPGGHVDLCAACAAAVGQDGGAS